MAGEWIKMRVDLQTHPKVVRILSAIRPHDVQTTSDKFRVIGGLHAVWGVFDTHSVDGRLLGYTPEMMDEMIGWSGFCQAMVSVGWLIVEAPETLALPEFDVHNGQSAKRRCEDQKRKRNARKAPDEGTDVRTLSANSPHATRTKSGLDKKEKENINKPPIPPKGGDPAPEKKRAAFGLKTYIDECKLQNVKPIPDDDPVFEYAQEAGIGDEMLALHWREFLARYKQPDAKKYKDWRSVFRKSVRGNWFKLWFFDPAGVCLLANAGLQARNVHKRKAA